MTGRIEAGLDDLQLVVGLRSGAGIPGVTLVVWTVRPRWWSRSRPLEKSKNEVREKYRKGFPEVVLHREHTCPARNLAKQLTMGCIQRRPDEARLNCRSSSICFWAEQRPRTFLVRG